jgi:hypothetical protein
MKEELQRAVAAASTMDVRQKHGTLGVALRRMRLVVPILAELAVELVLT